MFGFQDLTESESDKFIHRIMPICRLQDMLQNGNIGLLNPKMWEEEDPYENFLMNQNITLRSGKIVSFRELTKDLFGLCWTFNSNSDYAWKVYSRSSSKGQYFVQIKTKPNLLLNAFDFLKYDKNVSTLQIGKVTYIKWKKLKDKYEKKKTINPVELLFNFSSFEKRHEYRHEKEVRFLVRYLNHTQSVLKINFDLNDVCKTIMLDPRLPYKDFLLEKEKIKSWGFKGRIYRSTLYTSPKMKLIFSKMKD